MAKAALNPRWIKVVCANRGLLDIGLPAIEFGVSQLAEPELSLMYGRVFRLHGGTDDTADLEQMSMWLRTSREGLALSSAKNSTVETVVAPEPLTKDRVTTLQPRGDSIPDPDRAALLHEDRLAATRESHHVYGQKAAVCVEPTVVEDLDDPRQPAFHTISLEAAPIIQGQKRYAWEGKITIRLTKRELPQYCGLLLGCTESFAVENHGPAGDKSMTIDDQGHHLFIKIRQGSKALAVQVPPEEAYWLITMAIAVSLRNAPTLDSQTVTAAIKRCAAMENAKSGIDR